MPCCERLEIEEKIVSECPECGSEVDTEGVSNDICGYAPYDEACPEFIVQDNVGFYYVLDGSGK